MRLVAGRVSWSKILLWLTHIGEKEISNAYMAIEVLSRMRDVKKK
jgi:hypothetical protein